MVLNIGENFFQYRKAKHIPCNVDAKSHVFCLIIDVGELGINTEVRRPFVTRSSRFGIFISSQETLVKSSMRGISNSPLFLESQTAWDLYTCCTSRSALAVSSSQSTMG